MQYSNEEQAMQYNDTLRDELKEALLAAFPTVPLLRDMIHKTNFKFDSIVSYNSNLSNMVIDIISYASTQGQVEYLVTQAVSGNNNPQLRKFAQKIGIPVSQGPVATIYTTGSRPVPPTNQFTSPSLVSQEEAHQSSHVFISCSSADQQWIEQNVCQRLKRNKISYTGPGLRQEERTNALKQATKIVLIISPTFFTSSECKHDLRILQGFQAEAIKERVIRVQYRNTDKSNGSLMQFLVNSKFYNLVFPLNQTTRLANSLDQLIKLIQGEPREPSVKLPKGSSTTIVESGPIIQRPTTLSPLPPEVEQPAPPSPKPTSSSMTLFTGCRGNYVTWSYNAKKVAFADRDGTVCVWNVKNKSAQSWNTGKGAITAIALSPLGDTIAIASDDNTISLWNVMQKKIEHTYTGHRAKPTAIAWSFDSKNIASADDASTVSIWSSTAPGKTLVTFSEHQKIFSAIRYPIHALAWAHNNQDIASGSYGKVHIWQAQSGSLKTSIDIKDFISVLSWAPNDKYIGISNNGSIEVHVAHGGHLQSICKQHTQARNDPHKAVRIDTIAWLPDSTRLVAGGDNTNLLLWQIENGNKVHEYPHSQNALAAIWSDCLFSICTGNQVIRWDHSI